MFTKIDHIGIVTQDLDLELERYFNDYGVRTKEIETIEQRHLKLAFLELPGSTVELLAPLSQDCPQDSAQNCAVQKYLNEHGPGIHHIAYEVENINSSLQKLSLLNYRLIDTVARPGARGSLIAFIHPSSCNGVLTELVEYPNKS